MKSLLTWLLFSCFSSCALPVLRIAPRGAQYEISGSSSLSSGVGVGSFDLGEAGFDEDQAAGGRADVKMGILHLIGTYDAPGFSGQGTLGATIDDGMGNTIPVGSTVDSNLELTLANGLVVFDVIPGDTFEFALGVGGVYAKIDQRYTDVALSTVVSSEEDFALPVVAGVAAVQLGALELGLLASGIQLDVDGDDVLYLNGDLYGRLKLFGGSDRLRGSLVVGYLLNETDVDYEDGSTSVDTEIRIQAPYVGLQFTL